MTENKRFYYDFEDPKNHKIIDKATGKHFKLETIGDYKLLVDMMSILSYEYEKIKQQVDKIDDILDDINGKEYLSRNDCIKALNKIDEAIMNE